MSAHFHLYLCGRIAAEWLINMSRKQFLVELSQYLTFVSAEDREKIVAQYEKMFDDAGDDGITALETELGTPMKQAIELKRRKEAGEKIVPGDDDGDVSMPSADEVSEKGSETSGTQDDEASQQDIESEPSPPELSPEQDDTSDHETETEPAMEISEEPSPEAEAVAEAEISSDEPESDTSEPIDFSEPLDLTELPPASAAVSHAAPLSGGKRVAAGIGSVLLSVVLCLAFVAIGAIGMLLVIFMGDMILTGFGLFYRLADALLAIGVGLVGGAIGIVVVWLCIWAAITLTGKITGWMSVKKEAEAE